MTIRIYIYARKWSHVVEKLQINYHYIIDDVCEVYCLL
jgi:hypothetical protein